MSEIEAVISFLLIIILVFSAIRLIDNHMAAKRLKEKIKIAEEYLHHIAITHPHLIPTQKIKDGYRLTIYDTEHPRTISTIERLANLIRTAERK